VTTGANGRFRVVAVPPGQYILTVHRVGYVPLAAAVQIASLVSPSDVMAIEVYSGPATIPLQYRHSNSGCGVILIWTK